MAHYGSFPTNFKHIPCLWYIEHATMISILAENHAVISYIIKIQLWHQAAKWILELKHDANTGSRWIKHHIFRMALVCFGTFLKVRGFYLGGPGVETPRSGIWMCPWRKAEVTVWSIWWFTWGYRMGWGLKTSRTKTRTAALRWSMKKPLCILVFLKYLFFSPLFWSHWIYLQKHLCCQASSLLFDFGVGNRSPFTQQKIWEGSPAPGLPQGGALMNLSLNRSRWWERLWWCGFRWPQLVNIFEKVRIFPTFIHQLAAPFWMVSIQEGSLLDFNGFLRHLAP